MSKIFTLILRIIVFGLILSFTIEKTNAQTFQIIAVDTSEFPVLNAYFTAFDYSGLDFKDLKASEFDVWENGVSINPKVQIKCEASKFKPPISVVLVTDVSGSMNSPGAPPNPETLFQWVKAGATAFVDSVQLEDPSRLLILPFAGNIFETSGFQLDKGILKNFIDINLTTASGSTNFNVPFLGNVNDKGAIWHLGTRPKEIRRVIVFLTDGKHEKPGVTFEWEKIVDSCKANQIQVYCIVLKEQVAQELMWISERTGGKVFQVSKKNDLLAVYRQIAHEIQFKNFCRFVWTSDFGCEESTRQREVKATFKRIDPNLTSSLNFLAPTTSIAKLTNNGNIFYFGNPTDGTIEHDLVLTANNADFNISSYNITPEKTAFTLSKTPPFTIKKGMSETIKVRFVKTPPGNSTDYSLTFNTFPCPTTAVSLIAPCGGAAIDSVKYLNVPVSTSEDKIESCAFRNTTAVEIHGNAVIEGTNKAEFEIVEGGGYFTLQPNECLNVKVRFSPVSIGKKSAYIYFNIISDCGSPKTELYGTCIATDFTMPTVDWKERRIKTINNDTYIFKNNSTADINVIRVELADPTNPNFTLTKPSLPAVVSGNGQLTFPVSFTPQTEGLHEVDVILEIEGLSPALTGKLTGIGFLPDISADDIEFPATRVGGLATPIDLVIKNNSGYGNLVINEISIESQSNFSFGSGALTNITIPKNGEHRIPVNFTPSVPGLLQAQITIINDAVEGPEPIEQQTLIVNVKGNGLSLDVVDKLEFGSISTCSTLRKTVSITNPGDAAITFNGSITGTDMTAFELETPTLNIPGGESSEFVVIFKPLQAKSYSANFEITSEAGDAIIPLTGAGTVLPFSSKWKSGSMNIEVGKRLDAEFSSDIPDLAPTTVSEIIYHLTYNPHALKYDKSAGFTSNPSDWTWTVDDSEELKGKLTITGSGTAKNTPFSLKHNLSFSSFLSSDSTVNLSVMADFAGEVPCLNVTEDVANVRLLTCFTQGHLIKYSPTLYMLAAPQPNPAGETVKIKYNIAYKADTKIEIYNSLGNIVKTLVDGSLPEGSYESSFPVSELSSGVYMITMQSGPYKATQRLLISK